MYRRMFTLVAGAALAASGCNGISADSTLQEALDATGLGSVTVADVLGAMEDFTGKSLELPLGQALTPEQESALASLRAQLDQGSIGNQEYVERLAALVGLDPFGALGREASGGRRGPRGMGAGPASGGPRLAAALDLTQEQREQARTLFDAMRADVRTLRDAARTDIEALLTAEQTAILDSADTGLGHEFGLRLFGPRFDIDRLADELTLTQEQQDAVRTIVEALRSAVESRRDKAQADIRAILSAEQQTEFDAWLADRAAGGRNAGGF